MPARCAIPLGCLSWIKFIKIPLCVTATLKKGILPRTEANREQKQSFCLLHTRERWINLQRNSLRRAVEQVSKPSKTWDATSGGTTGEGGPSIRSSPVRIVSSAIPAPYTSLLFSFLANFLLVKGFKTSSYDATTSTAIAYAIDTGSGTLKRVATETQILCLLQELQEIYSSSLSKFSLNALDSQEQNTTILLRGGGGVEDLELTFLSRANCGTFCSNRL
jgi:hypothetical protein